MHDGPRNRFTSPRLFGATVAVVLAAAAVMAQDQPKPPAAFSIVPILEGVPIEGNRVQIRRGDEVRFRWMLDGQEMTTRSSRGFRSTNESPNPSAPTTQRLYTPAEWRDSVYIGEAIIPNAPIVFLTHGLYRWTFRTGREDEPDTAYYDVLVDVQPNPWTPAHAVLEDLTMTKTLSGITRLEATVWFNLDGPPPERLLCQALRLRPRCAFEEGPIDAHGRADLTWHEFGTQEIMQVRNAYLPDERQWQCEAAALEKYAGGLVWRASFSIDMAESPVTCEPVHWKLAGVGVLPSGEYVDFSADFETPDKPYPSAAAELERLMIEARQQRKAPRP